MIVVVLLYIAIAYSWLFLFLKIPNLCKMAGENDGPVAGTAIPAGKREDDGGVWNTAGSREALSPQLSKLGTRRKETNEGRPP